MAETWRTVRSGDLGTYENASDEFLKERAALLRTRVRESRTGFLDFMTGVVSHMVITGAAAAWSLWNGIEKAVFQWKGLNQRLGLKEGEVTHKFVHDVSGIDNFLAYWAEEYAGRTKPPTELLDELILHAKDRGFGTGIIDVVKAFHDEIAALPIEEQWARIGPFFEKLVLEHPVAYVSIFGEIAKELDGKRVSGIVPEARLTVKRMDLGRFTKEINDTNKEILNHYRKPTTIVLATGASLIAGGFAYRRMKKEKSLDNTVELTYIQKLQAERASTKHDKGQMAP